MNFEFNEATQDTADIPFRLSSAISLKGHPRAGASLQSRPVWGCTMLQICCERSGLKQMSGARAFGWNAI